MQEFVKLHYLKKKTKNNRLYLRRKASYIRTKDWMFSYFQLNRGVCVCEKIDYIRVTSLTQAIARHERWSPWEFRRIMIENAKQRLKERS